MEKPTERPEKREGAKNAKVDSVKDAKRPNSSDKLKHLIQKLLKHNKSDYLVLRTKIIYKTIKAAKQIFAAESALVAVEYPVVVVGDIHGQYTDLLRIFEMFDEKKDGSGCFARSFIFLGDYVDRGKNSLECILLLLALKLLHPERYTLLRGNHEVESVNSRFGFRAELLERFPLKKPIDVLGSPLVTDLLWADPMLGLDGFTKNKLRGVSVNFGEDVLTSLLDSLGLKLVIRGHQMMYDGFNFFGDRKLVTVFSAPAYHPSIHNPGAVLVIGKYGKIGFKTQSERTAERIFRGVEEGEEAHRYYGYIHYATEAEQLGSFLSGMSTSLSKK